MADTFLTINSLKLDRSGFCVARDLTGLLEQGAFRGDDFVSQAVAGRTFRQKVRDSHSILVPLLVFGLVDKDGVSHPDSYSGIRDNIEQIYTSCVEASDTTTVTATVTYPDAGTRSASVYCPRLDVGLVGNDVAGVVVSAVLEVVIPAGVLT